MINLLSFQSDILDMVRSRLQDELVTFRHEGNDYVGRVQAVWQECPGLIRAEIICGSTYWIVSIELIKPSIKTEGK